MKRFQIMAVMAIVGIGLVGVASADAGGFGHRGHSRSFYRGGSFGRQPIYHPPSVHYDAVPHSRLHWTPWRGLHIDTHYHRVPHYVPGHFDEAHGNHIHRNPWFHH